MKNHESFLQIKNYDSNKKNVEKEFIIQFPRNFIIIVKNLIFHVITLLVQRRFLQHMLKALKDFLCFV